MCLNNSFLVLQWSNSGQKTLSMSHKIRLIGVCPIRSGGGHRSAAQKLYQSTYASLSLRIWLLRSSSVVKLVSRHWVRQNSSVNEGRTNQLGCPPFSTQQKNRQGCTTVNQGHLIIGVTWDYWTSCWRYCCSFPALSRFTWLLGNAPIHSFWK